MISPFADQMVTDSPTRYCDPMKKNAANERMMSLNVTMTAHVAMTK